jgi:hypothetical protein
MEEGINLQVCTFCNLKLLEKCGGESELEHCSCNLWKCLVNVIPPGQTRSPLKPFSRRKEIPKHMALLLCCA